LKRKALKNAGNSALVLSRTRKELLDRVFTDYYELEGKTIFKEKELRFIFETLKDNLRMKSITFMKFIDFLRNTGYITDVKRISVDNSSRKLYFSKFFDPNSSFRNSLELAKTLYDNGYISHYTAAYLHGLTEQIPKTIYVRVEYPTYSDNDGEVKLTQERIDIAFSKPYKIPTKFSVKNFLGFRIKKIFTKKSQKVGVSKISIDDKSNLEVKITSIERTLIDIAVRPEYSGGISEVCKIYRNAVKMGVVNIHKVVNLIKRLNFVYPYHQTIGFLLELSGADSAELNYIRENFPIRYNFYLIHGMNKIDQEDQEDIVFVRDWKIYVPKSVLGERI